MAAMAAMKVSLAALLAMAACGNPSGAPNTGQDSTKTTDPSDAEASPPADASTTTSTRDATTEPQDASTDAPSVDPDASAPGVEAPDGLASCLVAGAPCTSDTRTCCSGVCGAPEGADAAMYCAGLCNVASDCASHCCLAYRNTTVTICEPVDFCGPAP
jgi:hypothetical protein